ncbi:response regulator [Aquimarina sp. 2201CG5-10]|uniref:hybrid sensor histidine kinase/response regulator n=1 Tax=Aquimarina callyspongiae TaxID=3098150 RepID=UPI002AB51F44|nr:transporter substrate-binding domain-containing protein [Aquimarina sp. 2201CG5-10]MDY8137329.1 transporter substrate-binding domain-containing protein [Aquimarina sp. 2201CG5-10]
MCKKLPLLLLQVTILIFLYSCSKNEDILNDQQKEWLQQQAPIKVAIFPYYPPYQLLNDEGNAEGIFPEYLELIEEKIGYNFQKVYFDTWPELMNAVEKEEVDIILEMPPSKTRESYLNFYAQLFETPNIITTRIADSLGTKISHFDGKTVVLPENYVIIEFLKQKYPQVDIVTCKNDFLCLRRLNAGEFDAYIGPKTVVHYLIKTKNFNNLQAIGETEFNYNPGLAVFKNNIVLNQIISKATQCVTKEEKQVILDNWLFNVVTPFYQTTKFWVLFSVVVIILLISILLINSYLKIKIKQRTRELRAAKENAEESDRLKTNFIRNISHEIRTPMNGIIGFSEFLNNPDLTPNERKEYTRIIINSGKQLMSIIEDILEISKLRSKQVSVNIEKTNLIILFQTLFSVFKIKAQEKNIDLLLENGLPDDQKLILIDKSKLNKILSNLIDNAIKFTDTGYVKISHKIKNELLQICIEDTGIGINTKDQEAIFASFSQSELEIAKNYGGLGLGLTIAKENVALIGGHIAFKTILGEGTTFTVTVPYNSVQSDIINTSIELDKPEESKKHIILIAEDGEVNFLFLKMILIKMTNYDFIIHRAKNGKEAVDLCQENNNIDLVLMDIKMPIMDGYDATAKIKKIRPDLPIIAQTAYSTEEDIQKALAAGCDDFVSKPVDSKILKPMLLKYFAMFRSPK